MKFTTSLFTIGLLMAVGTTSAIAQGSSITSTCTALLTSGNPNSVYTVAVGSTVDIPIQGLFNATFNNTSATQAITIIPHLYLELKFGASGLSTVDSKDVPLPSVTLNPNVGYDIPDVILGIHHTHAGGPGRFGAKAAVDAYAESPPGTVPISSHSSNSDFRSVDIHN